GLINVADRPYVDIFGPSTEADLTNPGLTNPGVLYTNYNIYKYMNDELTPIEAPNATNEEHEHNKTANFVKVPDGQAIDVAAGTSPGAGYVGSPLVITYADCVLGGTGMPGYGAQVYPAWDDSNLYLYVHVDDPTPGNNANSGAGIWNGDGLEVFIGPNQDELDVNTGFLADDVQIMLNGVYVNGKVDFYVRGANGQVDIPLDMALSYDASGKGYVVEVSIPWSGLGIANPVNGQQMRFDIGFDNANPSGAVGGGASGRDRQYLWTGYDKNSSDRMYWGTITLTDSVDKTALQAAVDDAQALVEADYTAASWADFAGALADAEAVLADDGATQAEVDAALAALNAAVAGLVEAAADVTLTGIAVETQPKLTYTETDKLDLSLLSVTLSYSDGSTQTVPYADFAADGGFALAYPNGDAAAQGDVMTAAYNGLTIAITYGDFTANTGALSVTVNAAYDVNGDGKVDSADLALIMANLNKKAATNAVTKKCDVDGSGMVDMNDYALVAAYIAAVAAAAP
ncbi:MAG: dockerin type I domain-containing protein, partial [Defluviitaleaceae bacterium]|nr:dockerin type I domain-containing protein [Defluviitaleaceae bacterium]